MKTSTAAHTPTPWSSKHAVNAVGDDALDCAISALIDGKPRCIAECFGRVGQTVFVDADANVAYIVLTVNSHEGLLQALKRMIVDSEGMRAEYSDLNEAVKQAKQAIAKAEGL